MTTTTELTLDERYQAAGREHGTTYELCPDCTRATYAVDHPNWDDCGYEDEALTVEHECPDEIDVIGQRGQVGVGWSSGTINLVAKDERGTAFVALSVENAKELIEALQALVDAPTA